MTAFNIEAANQIKKKLKMIVGSASDKVKVNNIDKIAKQIIM